ncbi:MAG: substrate-binding domain-containing protein [Paludibacteraceae bacterium]|nr:substrate-binding domain-containing protein [Paludibacteraceae bacterium]
MRNIVAIFLVCACFLGSCNNPQPQYRIGVSQCLDDAWRQKMNEEMERELLLYPEMTLTKRIAYGSNELQCAQIDSFIAERVNLLIVSPNEAEEVKPAVSRAFKAGIPVIVADRRVSGNEWTTFIGGDNYRVGLLMAEWVHKLQSAKHRPIHVVEVCGLPGSTPAMLRHQGLMEGLASMGGVQPSITPLQGEWYRENAYDAVLEYLRKHKNIDAIVAQNDLMAIGAAEAVRDSKGYGAGSVPIMGVDGIQIGIEAVAKGQLECTATYPSRGDIIIETAFQILTNTPFKRETVLETTLIDNIAAKAMLIKEAEERHQIETIRIIQMRADRRWQSMNVSRITLVVVLAIVLLLFCYALWTLFIKQTKIQREIRKEILPQLKDVQQTIQLSKRDEAFAERLKQVVEEHLTDPNLNVEFLSNMLHLSRTQIFRRVKAITGKGPLEYIRELRLMKADELLQTTDMTVQQVALELGFSNPSYFTKCYKELFGHLPSTRK